MVIDWGFSNHIRFYLLERWEIALIINQHITFCHSIFQYQPSSRLWEIWNRNLIWVNYKIWRLFICTKLESFPTTLEMHINQVIDLTHMTYFIIIRLNSLNIVLFIAPQKHFLEIELQGTSCAEVWFLLCWTWLSTLFCCGNASHDGGVND